MIDETTCDVALGVLRGFTMGEEIGSQSVTVVETQIRDQRARIAELEKGLREMEFENCYDENGIPTDHRAIVDDLLRLIEANR